ncbi:transmembrane gamma-carboxyglutamic acid protein 4 [Astyanax mexicanus]|uniref:Transmembrane gamma-carboxyglutamic acid protein 4 n=1 Tax=Astyanax mexicanus TaxID=7994 RepID=A0A8T2LPS0_ASTMX|nr:transmembrane gamma-carboxyglutamic acid protein 4 [Astyanax mexicanus]
MRTHLLVLFNLTFCGYFLHARFIDISEEDDENAVFVGEEEASKFLGRHLLLNRFDFEMFTPGNLERECVEEVCNYEEAREVFENIPDTNAFWKKYTEDHTSRPTRLDVTALLVGLIAGGVALVIVGLLTWYSCQKRCGKSERFAGPIRSRSRRSNASVIIRRLEEVSLQTIPAPPSIDGSEDHGLPSYEQAVARTGPHDAPPPPYPGSRPGTLHR